MLLELLGESCLIPALSSYLRNDSGMNPYVYEEQLNTEGLFIFDSVLLLLVVKLQIFLDLVELTRSVPVVIMQQSLC